MTTFRTLAAALFAAVLSLAPAMAAQAPINIGLAPNDGTGDDPRAAFDKANKNFSELYARGNLIHVKDAQYGAKWDGVRLSDCTTANGSTAVSCASGNFTSADVGKLWGTVASENVNVAPSAYNGRGTITAVNSPTSITVSTAPTGTVNGTAILYYGTDDTAALRAAAAAANPIDLPGTGSWTYNRSGVIVLPAGIGMISSAIPIRTGTAVVGQGMGQTYLKWLSLNRMADSADDTTWAALTMVGSNGSTRIYKDVIFRYFAVDMRAAFVTTYSYHSKCAEGHNLINPQVVGTACLGSPGTSWGYDYVMGGLVADNYGENPGRLFVSKGGGGSFTDFQSNSTGMNQATMRDYEGSIFHRNRVIRPATSAFRFTNNLSTLNTQGHGIISENYVLTDRISGKCIEDNGNVGAIISTNTCIATVPQTTAGTIDPSTGTYVDQEYNAGITSYGGNGGKIANNQLIGPWHYGIKMYRFRYNSSTLMPNDYVANNNTIKGSYRAGIALEVDSGYTLNNFSAIDNKIYGVGGCGIWAGPTQTGATGQINRLRLSNNDIYDNGQLTTTDAEQSGICLNVATAGLFMTGNNPYDTGSGKQKYGFTVNGVAVTGAWLNGNDLSSVATPINLAGGGTLAGEVVGNKGYRLGPVTVTLGASPATYTAGITPETLYLSGGTVTSIVRNGVTVAANSNVSIPLSANDNVVVTYSAAPAAVADRRQ